MQPISMSLKPSMLLLPIKIILVRIPQYYHPPFPCPSIFLCVHLLLLLRFALLHPDALASEVVGV